MPSAVISVVESVMAARAVLDRETARLAQIYERDELLRQFPVPSFAIGEVTLRLPYAAVEVVGAREDPRREPKPGEIPDIMVHVNADLLARLPEHAVAYVELKLNQQLTSLILNSEKPG